MLFSKVLNGMDEVAIVPHANSRLHLENPMHYEDQVDETPPRGYELL